LSKNDNAVPRVKPTHLPFQGGVSGTEVRAAAFEVCQWKWLRRWIPNY